MIDDIAELPGHHVATHTRHGSDVAHLHCECGWHFGCFVDDVDTHKQLHWAAKICEAEALDDLEAAVHDALHSLDVVDGVPREWVLDEHLRNNDA